MVNIKIDKTYSIKSDRSNFMVVRTTNQRESIISYNSTLESCITSFLEMKIRLSSAESIKELLSEIKSLQQALTLALTPFKIKVEVAK